MFDRVRVTSYRRSGRKFYYVHWFDPVTGRRCSQSTGETVKREADRFAAKLEVEINEGRYHKHLRTTWQEFRERYEDEVLSGQTENSQKSSASALNTVERLIDPKYLAGLDEEQISRITTALRKEHLSEATIQSYLIRLQAALNWAKGQKLIRNVPTIVMPTRSGPKAKGRAVTTEEFERMLAAIPAVVLPPERRKADPADWKPHELATIDSWRFLLRGLFWGGLRLGEAIALDWWDDTAWCVDLSGRRPMFRVRADHEKGNRERLLPMAPEFFELINRVPDGKRVGRVFNPIPRASLPAGERMNMDSVSKAISRIGEKSGVRVAHKKERDDEGKPVTVPRYASAHDLRRAFGFRWSLRVMPAVLQQLMRHESIQTTMEYYVGRNAEATADAAWSAVAATSGATEPETAAEPAPTKND